MTLIERLEAAEKGSRKMSDECLLAVGWRKGGDDEIYYWEPPGGVRVLPWGHQPDPSQNLQDAVTWMVPEGEKGWPFWEIKSPNPNSPYLKGYHGGSKAQIWLDGTTVFFGHARTPALALSIAALKSRDETD